MNDTPAAGNGLPPYRVRVVLDFEATDEAPQGLAFLASYLKTLLDLPGGANLSFADVAQAFPGAKARAAAIELNRRDGDAERRELAAP
ncbi:MAG TPA: hypothetical protein VGS22_29180 [Thermoanaerobaculia bacterium]|jgi:hypothetical protein|nr:hypothetical protein [Thermoanaerobaculia bacterium]